MTRPGALVTSLAAALAASGCARWPARPLAGIPEPAAPPPPVEKVVRIRVPVPVPIKCVPEDLGPPPVYPDNDQALRAAGGAADRYQLLAAGRILRDERLGKLEEVVRRCRQAAHPPTP
ncbi:MAG TPA: hypothetical protein VLI41_09430 [Phenylobacterium sp.]|uniref:hypothetical protein n=1 Tax=Phenylobacterium sp. TaxID=1871053 RepID=UPI002D160657|nr:hypothetical protein [Phenylobacterium sp.]HSV03414.1 hypothetical protein [Phenylobacterium sp.]